jgi:hypothetical protein
MDRSLLHRKHHAAFSIVASGSSPEQGKPPPAGGGPELAGWVAWIPRVLTCISWRRKFGRGAAGELPRRGVGGGAHRSPASRRRRHEFWAAATEEGCWGLGKGEKCLGGDGLRREWGTAATAAATVSGGTRGWPRRCCGLVWREYACALWRGQCRGG